LQLDTILVILKGKAIWGNVFRGWGTLNNEKFKKELFGGIYV
jgi:hypothetical protein